MPTKPIRNRPRQDRWSPTHADRHPHDIAAEWEAHLDAGRIHNHHACRPAVAANRDRTAMLFLRLAKEARQ